MTDGLQAALFDLDGLLVDSEPVWQAAEMEVFARHGLELTREQVASTKGMFVGEAVRHWYSRSPWPGATTDEVAGEIVDLVQSMLEGRAAPKPGAKAAVLEARRRGLKVAVASSSPLRIIEAVVAHLGMEGWFDVLHSGEQEPAGKPDPAIFLSAASLLDVEPGRCVVFEDSPAGVAAATSAGMGCVAVPEDGNLSVPAVQAAHVVIGSLEELGPEVWAALETRVVPRRGAGR